MKCVNIGLKAVANIVRTMTRRCAYTTELSVGGYTIKPLGVPKGGREVLLELARGHEVSHVTVEEGGELRLGGRLRISLAGVSRGRISLDIDMG